MKIVSVFLIAQKDSLKVFKVKKTATQISISQIMKYSNQTDVVKATPIINQSTDTSERTGLGHSLSGMLKGLAGLMSQPHPAFVRAKL